jgi:3-hydroxyisobutyrate dehydrogenase-like beta-hydroxyacid dehydrogenase
VGAEFVDAPVLGSTPAAEQGTLTVLAGGSEVATLAADPVLRVFGSRVVCTGEVGSASALKLVMNVLVGGLTELLAEGVLLAERSGLPKDVVRDALFASVLNSPFLGYKAPQLLDRKFSPLFTTGLMLKDLDLALSLAAEQGLELPGTSAIRDAYAATAAAGRRDEDFSAVIEQLDRASAAPATA